MPKYVTKKDCIQNGFIKNKNGIYKMSLLEKYYAKGWLEFGSNKYSAQDRLLAAEKLQRDYEMSRFMSVSAVAVKQKIDCTAAMRADDVESICKARERYFEAVKQIPEEFFAVIQKVCLEGKEPEVDEDLPTRRKFEISFSLKLDLCRGLDRLIKFYSFK